MKPVLARWGFSITFIPKTVDGFLIIKCVLQHGGGHIQETEISLPFDTSGSKNDVQAIGSSMTYGMRYTAVAILAISTFDGIAPADMDGNIDTHITDVEAMALRDHCKVNEQDESRLCVYYSKYYSKPIEDFEHLPAGSVENVENKINELAAR